MDSLHRAGRDVCSQRPTDVSASRDHQVEQRTRSGAIETNLCLDAGHRSSADDRQLLAFRVVVDLERARDGNARVVHITAQLRSDALASQQPVARFVIGVVCRAVFQKRRSVPKLTTRNRGYMVCEPDTKKSDRRVPGFQVKSCWLVCNVLSS